MSQIPRLGASKPLIKTTSTVTSKTRDGGTKTTTTTKVRELQPCSAGGRDRSQMSGCQPCPSKSGQKSMGPPQRTSGIKPPGAMQRMPPPQAQSSMTRPPQAGMSRIQPPAPTSRAGGQSSCRARQGGPPKSAPPVQMQATMPGPYNVPAPYGPMTRQGRGMAYSSPANLRGQMEARLPKELKYETIKGGTGAGARDRSTLPGTAMADTFAGNYNVYGGGGPTMSEEMVDRDVLNERVFN